MATCHVCDREFKEGGLGRHRGRKGSTCPYTDEERQHMAMYWKAIRLASAKQWRIDNPEKAAANEHKRAKRRKLVRHRRRASVRWWRRHGKVYRAGHRDEQLEQQRAWRAAHPELVRAQRKRYRARKRQRPVEPVAPNFTGHDLFEQALEIVGPRPSPGSHYMFAAEDTWEEAMSSVTLALLEGNDPERVLAQVRADARRVERFELAVRLR